MATLDSNGSRIPLFTSFLRASAMDLAVTVPVFFMGQGAPAFGNSYAYLRLSF